MLGLNVTRLESTGEVISRLCTSKFRYQQCLLLSVAVNFSTVFNRSSHTTFNVRFLTPSSVDPFIRSHGQERIPFEDQRYDSSMSTGALLRQLRQLRIYKYYSHTLCMDRKRLQIDHLWSDRRRLSRLGPDNV